MKKFDIGYIYYHLLSDFFTSVVLIMLFADDMLFGEDVPTEFTLTALPYFIIALFVVYVLFIIYRIIFYKSSGYILKEKEILCRQGVLFRKKSILDYSKIHAINKKQNIIHKLFKIAVLTIDSGSTNTSQTAEIKIIEKQATVDYLLEKLHTLKSGNATISAKETVLLSEKDTLYSFTSKRKVLYSVINMVSAVFFITLLLIFLGLILAFGNYALKLQLFSNIGRFLMYSLIILLGAMLVFSIFSFVVNIIYSFIGYHNFKISKKERMGRSVFGDVTISKGFSACGATESKVSWT